jgi:hypothetical protein
MDPCTCTHADQSTRRHGRRTAIMDFDLIFDGGRQIFTRVSVSLSLTSEMARTRFKVLFDSACQVLHMAPAARRPVILVHRREASYHLPARDSQQHTKTNNTTNDRSPSSSSVSTFASVHPSSTKLLDNHSFSTFISATHHQHYFQYVCLPPPPSPNQETLRQGHHTHTGQ